MGDEAALPWERAERPEGTGPGPSRLQERIAGKQVSRLHYLDALGPTGSLGFGLEFTTGEKLLIFAGRDRTSGYTARLFFRWLKTPLIVLPRMARAFAAGRDGDPASGAPDDLQRAVEGGVIEGPLSTREQAAGGGEMLAIEFRGGGKLMLWAEPTMKPTRDGPMTADIGYAWVEPERARVVLP